MEAAQSCRNVYIASKRQGRSQGDACGRGSEERGEAEVWTMERGRVPGDPPDSTVNPPAGFPSPRMPGLGSAPQTAGLRLACFLG